MALNAVAISGNLARDAETRQAGSMPVANFTVAVNDRRKNKQTGEWEDVPQWVDCTLLGTRAEKLAPYLTKGTRVSIQGKLHYSSWEAKDGSKRSKLDVTVDELVFMSRDGNGAQQPQQQYQPRQQQRYQPPAKSQRHAPLPNYAYDNQQASLRSVEEAAMPDVYDGDMPF